MDTVCLSQLYLPHYFIQEENVSTKLDDMDISKAVKNKHMTFNEAASLASLGNVKQLLLTHFSPSLENPHAYLNNATRIFPNTIIGEDRLSLSLNYED